MALYRPAGRREYEYRLRAINSPDTCRASQEPLSTDLILNSSLTYFLSHKIISLISVLARLIPFKSSLIITAQSVFLFYNTRTVPRFITSLSMKEHSAAHTL